MTLYFGYGSNLWLDQMKRRCPESQLIGLAILLDWRWMINQRGYANIVPSPGDVVYGLVFKLNEHDEAVLDGYEGVPHSYIKKTLPVTMLPQSQPKEATGMSGKMIDALVYVDEKRLEDSAPKEEYIYRINMGIVDATAYGLPSDYVKKYLRPFIPEMPLDQAQV